MSTPLTQSNTPSPDIAGQDETVKGRLGVRSGIKVTLSIDAMGGDRGPADHCRRPLHVLRPKIPIWIFILHGPGDELHKLVRKRKVLKDRVLIRDVPGVVTMDEKPSQAMRRTDTSMRSAIDAVKDGEAQACVSCGNTGALMATSMIRLRKLDGKSTAPPSPVFGLRAIPRGSTSCWTWAQISAQTNAICCNMQ